MSLDDMVKAGKQQQQQKKNTEKRSGSSSNRSRRGDNGKSKKHLTNRPRNQHQNRQRKVIAKGSAVISNLHANVTQRDLERLFENSTKVVLHKDRAGRSDGTADVQFYSHRDAQRAFDKYHHVPLDGHPLQIRVTSQPPSANATAKPASSASMMDVDSLDSALDNYMMNRDA